LGRRSAVALSHHITDTAIPSVSWFNSDENIVIVAAYSLLVLGELRELLAVNYDIKLVVYRNLALFTIQNLGDLQML
jgi:hypothetical protein